MKHLKKLAELFAELSINKKFPVEKWIQRYGVNVFVLNAYEWYTVDFGAIFLKYDNEEWTITGKETVLRDIVGIEQLADKYQTIYERFLADLPGLKADHIRKLQEQLIELKEEIKQVA